MQQIIIAATAGINYDECLKPSRVELKQVSQLNLEEIIKFIKNHKNAKLGPDDTL